MKQGKQDAKYYSYGLAQRYKWAGIFLIYSELLSDEKKYEVRVIFLHLAIWAPHFPKDRIFKLVKISQCILVL